MLTRVEIENFKAIENLTMDFTSRLTVIVGPNGSGKTSILQAIHLAFAGLTSLERRWNAAAPVTVRLFNANGCVEFTETTNPQAKERETLPEPRFLDLDLQEMVLPNFGTQGLVMRSDGSNLSGVLVGLRLYRPELLDEVVQQLRSVVPEVRQILFRPVDRKVLVSAPDSSSKQLKSVVGEEIVVEMLQAKSVPADQLSEGTLATLGILTAVVTSEQPVVLLIDDLDSSLHPAAQARLIETLQRLLDVRSELQIVATTHSPYLLNSLDFNEIRLTTLDDEGRVICGTLMDHPDFQRWKDEMTPGEMWGMWGESWLTKNRQEVLQP